MQRPQTAMPRNAVNARDAFPKSAEAHVEMLVPALQQRRAEMDTDWAELERRCEEVNDLMEATGVRSPTWEDDVLKLNIGGASVNVSRSRLTEVRGFSESTVGALFGVVWSKHVPRDADGRMVLDESPACLKTILTAMLSTFENCAITDIPGGAWISAAPVDEAPYLSYLAYALGLPHAVPINPKRIVATGGSTILGPLWLSAYGAVFRSWCPNDPSAMNLIYRASRDGFDTDLSKVPCTHGCPATITLIRVKGCDEYEDSVVGGFSSVSWHSVLGKGVCRSPGAFLFMLKDGTSTDKGPFTPVKWTTLPDFQHAAISGRPNAAPCFGFSDLHTIFDKQTSRCTIRTGREFYDICEDSRFLDINRQDVIDIEVYRLCSGRDLPSRPFVAKSCPQNGDDVLSEKEVGDIRLFGEEVACSFMEERVAIEQAAKAVTRAGMIASSACAARAAIYGPHVARFKDPVVEFCVRGTRMTTLATTLSACPDSTLLAAWFDKEKWPGLEKDMDKHGRWVLDCSPSFFSKVLDVLRIRKRASWSRSRAEWERDGVGHLPRVIVVKEADRACFDEFVSLYFPGCEWFIADLVV